MPSIFDNIEQDLLPALKETLAVSERADFCVGYFNLRGWGKVGEFVEKWSGGDTSCCRLLVGMQRLPQEELREALSLSGDAKAIDVQRVAQLNKKLAEEFRKQLMIGAPTNADEVALQRLASQIKAKKVIVKLFLRHPLHAKFFVTDHGALLGSCNLTWAGFENNIELAVRLEPEEVFDQLSLRDVMRPDLGQVSINDWKDFIHSLNKASRSSVTEAAIGKDGSWESFVQGLLAEGPPHLKTHLR